MEERTDDQPQRTEESASQPEETRADASSTPSPAAETPTADAMQLTSQEPPAEEPPVPFRLPDEGIEFEIVEPPEEESEDGFEKIPPGPTEEVRLEEEVPYRRRGRRKPAARRDVEAARAESPKALPSRRRFAFWLVAAVVGAVLLVAVLLVVLRGCGESRQRSLSPDLNKETHRAC